MRRDLPGGTADSYHFFWKPSPWNRFALVHRPDVCMPGIGWETVGRPTPVEVDFGEHGVRCYAFRFRRGNVHALELWGVWRNGDAVLIDYTPEQALGASVARPDLKLEGKRRSATEIVACSVIGENEPPAIHVAVEVMQSVFPIFPEMSDPRRRNTPRSKRRRKRRRRLISWTTFLTVAVIVVAGAKPAYRWLKTRRAEQLAVEGEALVRAGKLDEAARKYSAALQLDRFVYRALCGAARLASQGRRAEAADLWEQLIRSPRVTDADRRDYAAFYLLQRGRISAGEKILDTLLRGNPDTATLLLASRYAQTGGDSVKALQFVRIAAQRAPEDQMVQFRLVALLADSPAANERKEARDILWKLTGSNEAVRTKATEALVSDAPELSPDEQQRLIDLLKSLPPKVENALLEADVRLHLHPEQAEQIFNEVVTDWGRRDVTHSATVARWLNSHGQPRRALDLASTEIALENEPLMFARLDALGALGDWDMIDRLLAQPNLKFDPVILEVFRARSAQGRNAMLEAQVHWDRAISLAAADPAKLTYIANFSDKSGSYAVSEKALQQLARFPEQAAFAYSALQFVAQRAGDTRSQRLAAEKMVILRDDDPNTRAQLVYLNILTDNDVAANLEKAMQLSVSKYPNRIAFRVAAALGLLKTNDTTGAAAQLVGPAGAPPIEWSRTDPSWRAVYVAVLLANGKHDEARAIASKIPDDRLRPEERAPVAPAKL